jgi:O-antigen/teichoic acid export membrane protein
LTFVLTALYFRIDQPILYALRAHNEAGWYGAAYKPYEALLFVPMTLLSIAFPILSIYHRERPAEQIEAVNRFYKGLLLIGTPMAVGIIVLAHPLTSALRLYPQSEPALRILALATAVGFVNNAFIGALGASDRQSSLTWAAGWSLVVNVGLNLALIPVFGYLGASWATVVTEFVLGIAAWALTARHVGRVPVLRLSWRPLLAGLLMGLALLPLRDFGGIAIAIPILVGAGLYTALALLLRAVTADEVRFARSALALTR